MLFTDRRNLFLAVYATFASMALAGCPAGTTPNTTVQGIIDWLKTNCQFATTADMVVAVLVTVVAGFNAAAGAGAAVAAAVAKQAEDAICNAVKTQLAQASLGAALGAGDEIKIVVNGVHVVGTYTGK
jgi:hypothetical protein